MKKLLITILALGALALCNSCQEPEDLIPSVSKNGINSFVAKFPDDDLEENAFYGEIDYVNHTIVVVVPYTYPAETETHNTTAKLIKMRVEAGLDDNVIIDPPLYWMDLTEPNYFTLTDQRGEKSKWTVTAEIRKSADCSILDFAIPDLGIISIVDLETSTVSLLTNNMLGSAKATAKVAFGASISPDPATTSVNYDNNPTFTVTAQDGKTTKTYTIEKKIPTKRQSGMREGSGAVIWAKKMSNITSSTQMSTTLASLSDYVVINTRGEDLAVLDRKNGSKVGSIALPFKSANGNFAVTSDDTDNILVCNFTGSNGDGNVFKVYRIKGINGTPELYIEFDNGGVEMGRKFSVLGSLDSKAVIVAPVYYTDNEFYRWTVTDGVLNPTPEKISVLGYGRWNLSCDIIPMGFSATSDYLVCSYASPTYRHYLIDGKTNTERSIGWYVDSSAGGNWVPNAVDYVSFNNNPYAAFNSVNGWEWGSDDQAYLYDVSTNTLDDIIWSTGPGLYGAKETTGTKNAGYLGDVALRVSDDGFFMYLYFMFSDGYVACAQFDCIAK